MQQAVANILFHDNVNNIGTGYELVISNGISSVNIEFETTGTFNAIFEAKANPNTTIWKPIMGCNLGTLELTTNVTDKTYIYQVDVTGISLLRVDLTSVSESISVYGRCVS